jgi:hypothetical protein
MGGRCRSVVHSTVCSRRSSANSEGAICVACRSPGQSGFRRCQASAKVLPEPSSAPSVPGVMHRTDQRPSRRSIKSMNLDSSCPLTNAVNCRSASFGDVALRSIIFFFLHLKGKRPLLAGPWCERNCRTTSGTEALSCGELRSNPLLLRIRLSRLIGRCVNRCV